MHTVVSILDTVSFFTALHLVVVVWNSCWPGLSYFISHGN